MRKLLIFTISLLILVGCGKPPVNKPYKEIVFWTLQLSGFSGYINEVISEYEHLNPDIKVKWVDVPFSEGEKRALAAVLSKDVPDLINMNPDFSATLASKGALTDVKPLISPEIYDNYIPISWQNLSIGDMVFGIPWYITSAVTFYNKGILSEARIMSIPERYEELEAVASKIKAVTGKYVLMPALTENGKMLKIFNKYDIPISQKAEFNTPEAKEILLFWKRLYEREYIPAESITQGHRDALGKFQSGETAFIVAGANFAKIIKENSPQLYRKLGVAPQLTGSKGKADFALMNLVIPKNSKHANEALKFALFLTNKQNQLEFCKLAPILPSEKNALKTKFFREESDDLIVQSRVISAKQLENPLQPLPYLENKKDLYEIIDYMTQEVLLGEKSPEQALNKAKIEWNKLNSQQID